MSKKDNSEQADDTVVDESAETVEEPTVELDRPTDVTGDLIENPVLEEEVEDQEDDVSDDSAEDADEDTGGEEDDSDRTTDGTEPGESEQAPEADVTAEKDETGVYSNTTAADPGEFQPTGDYGFDVTTADGKTIKINTPAEAEAFAERLDNEEGLLTARQFIQFNRGVSRMDNGIDREQAAHEAEKEAFETQQAQVRVRDEQITQWSKEVNYLEAKGLVPKITNELNTANWTDPKIAEEPAVKERLAIFKYMETENNERRAAGIAELTSAVDAFRLMQADSQEDTGKVTSKRETAERRARGKMVSGNSSFTPANEQPNSIIGEGGNLRDLIAEAQMR